MRPSNRAMGSPALLCSSGHRNTIAIRRQQIFALQYPGAFSDLASTRALEPQPLEVVWRGPRRNNGRRGPGSKFSTGSSWVLPAETSAASTQESNDSLSLTALTQATEARRRGRKAQLNAESSKCSAGGTNFADMGVRARRGGPGCVRRGRLGSRRSAARSGTAGLRRAPS